MSERTQRDEAPDKDWGRVVPIVHAHARARHRSSRIAARNPHNRDYGGNFTKKDPRWRLADD